MRSLVCLAAVLMIPLVVVADPVPATQALRLGPLPTPPAGDLDVRVHATSETVPEIDLHGGFPESGELKWTQVTAESGALPLPDPGVWWLAARLVTDRWAELTLDAGENAEIWIDGESVDGAVAVPGGACFVLVRVVTDQGGDAVSLSVDGAAVATWDTEPRLDLSRFDRARAVSSIGSIAVAPKGRLVAYNASRRDATGEGRRGQVQVVDGRGQLVAADLGGPKARPVAFTPDGERLLLRRSGADGTDLLFWTAPRGPMRTLVTDEPGLGFAKLDPRGRRLLVATERGLEADDPDDAQRRWDALRERVTDWTPRPHLQLVDLETGLRRVLTQPGDHVLDDAAWLPGGKRIIYARTVPQVLRPWFRTEIRVLDLATGADELTATFTGGWEVRPQALTPHPDGRLVAFVGPPEEVGGGNAEHNVYNKQIWMLDLNDGSFRRATTGLRYAFSGARGLPAWRDGGRRLVAPANAGGRDLLVSLDTRPDPWEAEELPQARDVGSGWALSPDTDWVAFTASDPVTPRSLWLQPLNGTARELAAPDRESLERLDISGVRDVDFSGPGGETIEAWEYRPLGVDFENAEAASIPLIVYYYGGSSPTSRTFNTTHQFWAANGYAVLVINPRGATGYGGEYADHHAGDWGPAAAADILAGVDMLLARHPQLNPEAVGCYGGSYGGFMTMYLVTRSDQFAAAVSMYGIADLATYWGQGTWGWTYGDMAVGGRMPWNEPGYFTEHSPLYAAGDVNTPLLLLHGASDANVTPGESYEMFTALQVQGKPVEMVTFAGEDHGIAGTWENYVAHRTMMLEWFDRWLKGMPEAWEHRWAR